VQKFYYPVNALPKSTVEKQITARGSSSGKLGQLTKAQTVVSEYETDNKSHSYSDYIAAKSFLDDFEKTGQVKEAQIEYLGQGVKGTRKIQPAQQEGFEIQKSSQARLENNRSEDIQLKLNEAEAKLSEAQSIYQSATIRAQKEEERHSKAQVDLDNGDITRNEYERIKNDYDAALTAYNNTKASREAAKKVVDGLKNISSTRTGSSNIDNISKLLEDPRNKELIKQVRSKNPKTKLSDEQILKAILKASNK
jgi:hypothetical protein